MAPGKAAEAYIIMRADGTLLPRDIKKFAGEAGEQVGEEMGEGFDKEFAEAQERSMKKFRRNVAESLDSADFTKFRKKGETVAATFDRLSVTMKQLHRDGQLSDDMYGRFFEQFSKYTEIEYTNSSLKRFAETSRLAGIETKKNREALVGLTTGMKTLDRETRKWLDRKILDSVRENDWKKLVDLTGSYEEALRVVKNRTDENRRANKGLSASMDEIDKSLVNWIKHAKEKTKSAEATKKQVDADKALANANVEIEENLKKANADRIKRLEALQRSVDKTTDKSREMLDALTGKAYETGDWDKVDKHLQKIGVTMGKATDEGDSMAQMMRVVDERMSELNKEGRLNDETYTKLHTSMSRYVDQQKRVVGGLNNEQRAMRSVADVHRDVSVAVEKSHKPRRDLILSYNKIGDGVGRSFGRGARNNVINLFGALVGGITKFALTAPMKLFNGMTTAVETFSGTFGELTKSVAEGGQGMKAVPAIFSALGAAMAGLVPTAIAAAIAIPVLSAVMGAFASFVSLAAANVLVLIGVVGQALLAPLMALVPAIVAFGAGAVVAGFAIAGWAKESKALKRAFAPVKEEMEKLSKSITPVMDKMAKLWGPGAQKMVQKFGGAVERVLEDAYKKMADPRMSKFYDQWQKSMPRIFESLGKSISSFGQGLTAFFVPILPYAERLGDAIERSADRFTKWAQSAGGQNAIADWMQRAWDIAKSLWAGLQDISSALLNIIGIGTKQEGQGFADWIKDIGDRFHTWTESEQGRKDIKQWFKDAKNLAKDVKEVIKNIADAFDALDSKNGRKMMDSFMDFIIFVSDSAVTAAENIDRVNAAVNGFSEGINTFKEWTETQKGMKGGVDWRKLAGDIEVFWDANKGTAGGLDWTSLTSGIRKFWDANKGTKGGVNWRKLGGDIAAFWEANRGIKGGTDWRALGEDIKSFWDANKGMRGGIDWRSLGDDLKHFWDSNKGAKGGVDWRKLGDDLKHFWDSNKGAEGGLDIKSWWNSDDAQWFKNQWEGLKTWWDENKGFEGGLEFEQLWTDFKAGWDTFLEQAKGIDWGAVWDEIVNGLKMGLDAHWEVIKKQGEDVGRAIVDGLKYFLGIESPSTKMIELMGDVADGIVQGILAIPGKILASILALGTFMVDQFRAAFDKIKNTVSEKFGEIKNAVTTKASEIGSTIKAKFGEYGGKARDALSDLKEKVGSRFDDAKTRAVSTAQSLVDRGKSIMGEMPSKASSALSSLGSKVKSRFDTAKSNATRSASSLVSAAKSKYGEMPSRASSALASLSSRVRSKFDSAKSSATRSASSLVSQARSTLSRMSGSASSALSGVPSAIRRPFDSARSAATGAVRNIISSVRSTLSGITWDIGWAMGGVSGAITGPLQAALGAVQRIAGQIRSAISGAVSSAGMASGGIGGSISGLRAPNPRGMASGGMTAGPAMRLIGESGPEAIVPLMRPLNQVDSSVRHLSAIAQGLVPGGGSGGATVQAGAITISSPYADPALVANQVLDDLVANL